MVIGVAKIRQWLNAKPEGSTNMVVFCDTFDHADFPFYIAKGQNVRNIIADRTNNRFITLMEVYSFAHDLEEQLKEYRAFHYD